jgi:lysophospholipase L1-like esterase
MRLLVFGDSIAQGYYDLESGGWVNLLAQDVMRRKARRTDYASELFNVAISGNFTRNVITRLEAEIQSRLWNSEPVSLVIAVGINDTHVADGVAVSSPERFRAELEQLHTLAAHYSDHITYVGLTPVDESEANPWRFNTGSRELVWTNDRIKAFDDVLAEFAASVSAPYIPLFDDMLQRMNNGEQLMMDGLHPNSEGHRLMYQCIKNHVHL